MLIIIIVPFFMSFIALYELGHNYQPLNLLMLRKALFTLRKGLAIITPEAYPKLHQQFEQRPQISTFGEYFVPDNVLELFNIVRETPMDPNSRLNVYRAMEEQLFVNNTDLEFNVLANIHKEKSTIYSQMNNVALAIEEIDKAISAIQGMDDPFALEVAVLYQMGATLYMRVEGYSKAENYLNQAQYTLKLVEDQIWEQQQASTEAKQNQMKGIDAILARVYSSLCLLKMQQRNVVAAREHIAQALQKWDNVEPASRNSIPYLLTIKYKCLLHLASREQEESVNTALTYLKEVPELEETVAHRMWFMKFLADHGHNEYKEELKEKIQALSNIMPLPELNTLLSKLGLISRRNPKEQK